MNLVETHLQLARQGLALLSPGCALGPCLQHPLHWASVSRTGQHGSSPTHRLSGPGAYGGEVVGRRGNRKGGVQEGKADLILSSKEGWGG